VNKEEMTRWLYDRFIEKEQMLDKFYKTGTFPSQEFCRSRAPTAPQVVAQDPLRFFILHLFFITSSYIHYHMLTYFFSYFFM
jgi:lysophosphatidylglycerol acyltransferase 1